MPADDEQTTTMRAQISRTRGEPSSEPKRARSVMVARRLALLGVACGVVDACASASQSPANGKVTRANSLAATNVSVAASSSVASADASIADAAIVIDAAPSVSIADVADAIAPDAMGASDAPPRVATADAGPMPACPSRPMHPETGWTGQICTYVGQRCAQYVKLIDADWTCLCRKSSDAADARWLCRKTGGGPPKTVCPTEEPAEGSHCDAGAICSGTTASRAKYPYGGRSWRCTCAGAVGWICETLPSPGGPLMPPELPTVDAACAATVERRAIA